MSEIVLYYSVGDFPRFGNTKSLILQDQCGPLGSTNEINDLDIHHPHSDFASCASASLNQTARARTLPT